VKNFFVLDDKEIMYTPDDISFDLCEKRQKKSIQLIFDDYCATRLGIQPLEYWITHARLAGK
jgi:hypothetical protein